MCPDLRSFCIDAALLHWQTSSLCSNTHTHTHFLFLSPSPFISLPFHPPSSILSSSSEVAGKSSLSAQKALPLWSGPTSVTEFMGLPWQQAPLATHQEAGTNWKGLSFPWDMLHLFSAADPVPVLYYGKRVGGRERKKHQGFIIFSVFSVGEDHKLFSETDILFLMQPVWGAEGGAHVHFWWTQLVSQGRKNKLFGSKVSFW